MEHRRHILPSNYPPQASSELQRPHRQPLTDSSGNAQYSTLASSGLYNDQKLQFQYAPPKISLPTLPSQPAPPYMSQLGLRREQTRRHRATRDSRNPIRDSTHYQAYRARQLKDSDSDQKWSEQLEEAFLEALIVIPRMGRRKFSLQGKPHGRNELISLYLWIAYRDSLPPGQVPDESMRRTRKQVSSHIQVLKGFMRGHPAFEQLFPSKENPKNGFQDSFKDDPCLRELAMNRLPFRRHRHFDYLPSMGPPSSHRAPIQPTNFHMYIGVPNPDLPMIPGKDPALRTVHEFISSPLCATRRDTLESIPNWRHRFPLLAKAYNLTDINCDIIHVSVSLALNNGNRPNDSSLCGAFEIYVPDADDSDLRAGWRCESSMYKHKDLQGPVESDKPWDALQCNINDVKYSPGHGSFLHVPFPALPWAHALVKLAEMERDFVEAQQHGQPAPFIQSARQYIEQIGMYQEIFARSSPGAPWKRRAFVVWTFQKAPTGESGNASWRYLDVAPPRQRLFEPHPPPQHLVSAAMTENFNAWTDPLQDPLNQHLNIHVPPPGGYEPLLQGLATPPHTGVLNYDHSYPAYDPHQINDYSNNAAENLSLLTNDTQDSDSTHVESQGHPVHTMESNPYISAEHVDLSFESGSGSNLWAAPPIEAFDGDASSFLGSFGPPGSDQQGWEVGNGDGKNGAWDVGAEIGNFGGYEPGLIQRLK